MPLQDVIIGPLTQLEADEQVPLEKALDATNCYVDDLTIRGRNGYRAASAAPIGAGLAQGLFRFRPLDTSARTVGIQAGTVYTMTDPSTELLADGTVASATGVTQPAFGATDLISAVQYGKYLYMGSDQALNGIGNFVRMKSDFTLQAYAPIPAPPAVTATQSSALSLTKLTSLAAGVAAGGAVISATFFTDWYQVSGTVGGTATWDLGADTNWSTYGWLFVACSPESTSGGGGTFKVSLISSAGTGSVEEQLNIISDTPGDGSPYCVYFSLQNLSAATRAAVRKIRFTQYGPTTDPFSVHGLMAVPQAPSSGQINYFTTFSSNTVAGVAPSLLESDLSPAVPVVYSSDGVVFPTFHAARWNYNAFQDIGTKSVNPDSLDPAGLFNKSGGLAYPAASDFALVYQFAQTVSAAVAATANTVNLYRQTSLGVQLVKSAALSGTSTITITDDTGQSTLSHALYKAGGAPPPCRALAACRGRLVAGGDPSNPSRISISSYAPFTAANDPFPVFPAVPQITADGWSFDIAPTPSEQVLWLGNGDLALYILTNEACYVMTSLDPNSTPFKVFERGAMGRRAACWAESSLFWAGHDGIYMATNRSNSDEVSRPIRRLYAQWFLPDATTVVSYQDRKLYAVTGTRMLRYDFVTQTWTRHNLAHSMRHADDWREPTGSLQRMFYLDSVGNVYRWQPGLYPADTNRATSDAGTAIAAWTFSTGFAFRSLFSLNEGYADVKTRCRSIFLDLSAGPVTVSVYKDATGSLILSKAFPNAGEHQLPFSPGLIGYKWRLGLAGANSIQVKRILWERVAVVGGEGG